MLKDGSLWQQDPAIGGVGVNAGWTKLSPAGTIASVSAVTGQSGNPTVYAIVTDDTLWEHSAALGGDGWAQISTGSYQAVGAGLDGSGQAMVYGTLVNGALWEQDSANAAGLNVGWTKLSGVGGAPAAFLGAAAGAADTVFAIASDNTLWQDTGSGFQQISTAGFAQVSSSETASQDLAFGALTDGAFWEYSAAAPGDHWTQSMTNGQPVTGVASSSTP